MYDLTEQLQETSHQQTRPVWHYSAEPESRYHPELGDYQTYAITARSPEETYTMHDVSPCKDTVDAMVLLFTRHQLFPIHLRDVIEDMLL